MIAIGGASGNEFFLLGGMSMMLVAIGLMSVFLEDDGVEDLVIVKT